MIYSMTGFSNIKRQNRLCSWNWELKSLNAKGLDLRCRLPKGFEHLEVKIKEILSSVFQRGNISVGLNLTWLKSQGCYHVNKSALTQILKFLGPIEKELNNKARSSASDLLRLPGVLEVLDTHISDVEQKKLDEIFLKDLHEAISNLKTMREREGGHLYIILVKQLSRIKNLINDAEKLLKKEPQLLKKRFEESINKVLKLDSELPKERIIQEIALLAAKADIREELDRLKSHHKEALNLLESEGSVGRKLDFLCQELNREVNTLCAKSSFIEMIKLGVEMKVFVEQFREQIQNIE